MGCLWVSLSYHQIFDFLGRTLTNRSALSAYPEPWAYNVNRLGDGGSSNKYADWSAND